MYSATSLISTYTNPFTQWFVEWWDNAREAHYVYKQTLIVYYFPGQVGQGKIKWEEAAAQALLRDKVLHNWPKDDAGWPKSMSREDEEAYVSGLGPEERHAVSGLGGSQKAEVAWLDKHGIAYKEVDVGDFITSGSTGTKRKQTELLEKMPTKLSLKIVPAVPTQDEEEISDVSEMEEGEAGEETDDEI